MEETMTVEEQYMDVLQNIEFGIVLTYKDHREISDYNVMRTLEALIDRYTGEKVGRPQRHFLLSNVELILLENVHRMCEWRLGRWTLTDDPQKAEVATPTPKTIDEIILCLKRVLKSVKRWNKSGGMRGYLDFIVQYVK